MSDRDQVKFILQFIAIGVRVLNARLALFISVGMTFILFGWAAWHSDLIQLAVAASFALMVFLPIIRLDHQHGEARSTIQGEQE